MMEPQTQSWSRKLTLYFRSLKVPTETLLSDYIADNPYYPFKQIHVGKLEYATHYTGFYVSIIGMICSSLAAITYIVFGIINGHSLRSPIFPLPFFLIAISFAAFLNFSDVKYYNIYPLSNEYSFSYNDKEQIRCENHNIYIRLRRDLRPTSDKKWYYLVLKGYQMEKIQLCSASTNQEELRRIGQSLAANLNINYFDEANISKHHVIRHFRANKDIFSLRNMKY